LREKTWSDFFGSRGTRFVHGWIVDDFRVSGIEDD